MNTFIKLASIAAISVSLSGCLIVAGDRDWNNGDWEDKQTQNRQAISNLTLQMTRTQVIERLGIASFSEAFVNKGNEYQILYYRTQRTKSDGETTKDETTPLVFEKNKLIGWGNEALAKAH